MKGLSGVAGQGEQEAVADTQTIHADAQPVGQRSLSSGRRFSPLLHGGLPGRLHRGVWGGHGA
jgi:hypothetical protein